MRNLVSQNLKPLQDSVIAVIKAICETIDAIMDWKKSKKLIESEKTDNENMEKTGLYL
jgi:hypothetical protein